MFSKPILINVIRQRVNVELRRCGGAFGAKITRANIVACACALAAHILQKPVRMVMTLETNMRAVGGRYLNFVQYEVISAPKYTSLCKLPPLKIPCWKYKINGKGWGYGCWVGCVQRTRLTSVALIKRHNKSLEISSTLENLTWNNYKHLNYLNLCNCVPN